MWQSVNLFVFQSRPGRQLPIIAPHGRRNKSLDISRLNHLTGFRCRNLALIGIRYHTQGDSGLGAQSGNRFDMYPALPVFTVGSAVKSKSLRPIGGLQDMVFGFLTGCDYRVPGTCQLEEL